MKVIQIKSSGFGKQLYLAETVEGGIEQFKAWVGRVDKLNGEETPASDLVISQARVVGTVINHKP